ncbi:MAG: DMT family transporter [Desulfurococcaceae archaeon]
MRAKHLKILGFLSLVATTILWGTSFVFIKLSMSDINSFTYTFTRTLIAVIALLPFILTRIVNGSMDYSSLRNGFITGIAYSTGLCLQAAGTAYIDPSISAFITGISTIHVHMYSALAMKKYSYLDLFSLIMAITGLYYLTMPASGIGVGEILVFAATFAWASQIILISSFRSSSMIEFLFGMFASGVLFLPMALAYGYNLSREALLYIAYLAIVCSIAATFFQVLGQRYISPSTASLVFLLEPVFALLFSVFMGLEIVELHKIIGGGLIVSALYIALISELKTYY